MAHNRQIISNDEVLSQIEHNVNSRIPSSFIRKGDGENIVLSYKKINSIKFKDYKHMMRIMNIRLINFNFQKYIKYELVNSFKNCDILGISKEDQRYGHWEIEDQVIMMFGLDLKRYCDMNFHMNFVKYPNEKNIRNLKARKIISNKDIGVISCFNVINFLEDHNSNLINWIKMPIQRDSMFNKKIDNNFYKNVFSSITSLKNVDCWLVAAGIHGKIFCNYIKIFGGIAIDIGSSIDSWKNIYNSRGYLKDILRKSIQ